MFQVIQRERGSGKSKGLIKFANDNIKDAKGHIVFLDDSSRNHCELHHDVRFINYNEYGIKTVEELIGFILGICSRDYDIRDLIIDGADDILINEEAIEDLKYRLKKDLDYIRVKVALNTKE